MSAHSDGCVVQPYVEQTVTINEHVEVVTSHDVGGRQVGLGPDVTAGPVHTVSTGFLWSSARLGLWCDYGRVATCSVALAKCAGPVDQPGGGSTDRA